MKKVYSGFPDKPLSRATKYRWFRALEDGVSDTPSGKSCGDRKSRPSLHVKGTRFIPNLFEQHSAEAVDRVWPTWIPPIMVGEVCKLPNFYMFVSAAVTTQIGLELAKRCGFYSTKTGLVEATELHE